MTNIRINCAKIVQSVIEEKIFFGELKKQLSEKDLPFCNMLVLTALRNWNALNKLLTNYLNKNIAHKNRLAQYLLLLAMAELLFMNTAEYAVIDETVKNIRQTCDKFLAGMANAILRKIAQDKKELQESLTKINPLPKEFKTILADYNKEQINLIAQSIKQIPPLDISVKNNHSFWAKKLNATILPNGSLRIFDASQIHNLDGYNDGQWWVQDVAASLPVLAMGNLQGLNVIDLCAAPGGKTAQLLAQGANVIALDISASRLETLKLNMNRLGFNNVQTQAIDALEYLQNSKEQFDAILLDAPCSATGTFRRHPEVLYIKNENDVEKQVILQKQLLSLCLNVLKIGGILLYSVCSISKAEGENQIAEFLADNKNFELVAIDEADISKFGKWNDSLLSENGTIRTLPYFENQQNGMDAFFICKMKRII